MRNEGLGSWTARRARMTPDRLAVVHDGTRRTCSELHRRTTRLARALHELGVRQGDRVAYLGPNHPAYLESLFACGMLGALFVPVNSRLTAAEVEHVLRDSGACALVHDHRSVADELPATQAPHRIALSDPASSEHDYGALVDAASEDPIDRPVALSDPCLIMYTSGTTGTPKGAVLTHGNLTWNCVNALVESEWSARDRALVVAPLFHIAVLGMVTLPALLKGATVHLDGFDAGRVLATLHSGRTTVMFGVPTMFRRMAEHSDFNSTDLSGVRTLLCGGSPVPPDLIDVYSERGLSFQQGYGMTETSPGVLLSDPGSDPAGSAGVPSFFTDVRVADEDGSPVAPGEKGEVRVCGPNVTPGYWGRPEDTARSFADGWFRSGDAATVDDQGHIRIVDRIKDVIISGGENVYPAEVERALHEHPEVSLCAIIGVTDESWGEVGKAVVVLARRDGVDAATLLAFLRERLARYKIPRSVEFTDDLPISGAGKLLKPRIRELFG